jgi:hypothetical protein
MFKYNHYVPILKGKSGELDALANLSKEFKRKFTPLIDIPPISFVNSDDVKTLDRFTKKMITSWGNKHPFFVDLSIKSSRKNSNDTHPITYMFRYINSKMYPFSPIPTTGIIRDDTYNEAIKEIIQNYSSDVCIRLFDDDMINVDELADELKDLLTKLDTVAQKAHLLLDFRAITEKNMFDVAVTTNNIIGRLSGIEKWKTLILAASSIPEIVGKKNKIVRIPRIEFSLWKHIISKSKNNARIPSYGDYGITHPNHRVLDMKSMNISPKIRYTLEEDWLIVKGQKPQPALNRASQYQNLSKKLINMDEFMYKSFSEGDKYIANYASGEIISGDLTKWVEIDTTQHITLVSNQIANFVVSSSYF